MLSCEPGRVAVVTLDRPPANALNRAFFDELIALRDRLRAPDVGAVVITGTGRFFSAGLDLFEVFAYPPREFDEFTQRFDVGFGALFAFPKPVVAAVNGHAIAGGAVLAAAADFRLVADGEGRMGLTEILLGVPFPVSVLEIVRYACAGPALPELLYHGRTYRPRDAHARHLADEVVPATELLARARALAEELAGRPRAAFEQTKVSLRADALRRLESARRDGDPAWDVWRSAETHAAVEAYRARTLGAKGRG
jgi:enoyl-CoA hydratase/carnithine racemase